jgi:hypothetical protein
MKPTKGTRVHIISLDKPGTITELHLKDVIVKLDCGGSVAVRYEDIKSLEYQQNS